MNINFTDEELKEFPLLAKIEEGMEVIAMNDSYYVGLKGHICDIKYDEDKETDNEDILDIYVDFEVPTHVTDGLSEYKAYDAAQEYLDKYYPELNGTSIGEVIMGEDMLGYKFDQDSEDFISITGNKISPVTFCEIEKDFINPVVFMTAC